MLRLTLKACSAPSAVGNCERNAQVHSQVLQRYDIGNITSAKQNWWHNRQTSVLLLENSATAEPLGAIRLQRWDSGQPLPIESALADVDRRIHDWVASYSSGGVAELCGLWCSPKLRGYGVGAVLTRMGLSLAPQVKAKTILGLCDTRSVAQNLSFGFDKDPSLASQGTFGYPRPGLFAHVLRVPDAQCLDRATSENRQAIEGYRREPVGREVIEGRWGRLELVRDLRLDAAAEMAKDRGLVQRALNGLEAVLGRLSEEPA
jgi:hypothetical protein